MTHKPNCDIYSNLGIPSAQKDESYCTCASLPSQEPVERVTKKVVKMKAGYSWKMYSDGSRTLVKGNATWSDVTRAVSHLTQELETAQKALSHQKALSRAEVLEERRGWIKEATERMEILVVRDVADSFENGKNAGLSEAIKILEDLK